MGNMVEMAEGAVAQHSETKTPQTNPPSNVLHETIRSEMEAPPRPAPSRGGIGFGMFELA